MDWREGTPRILLDSFRIVQDFQASRETARFTLVEDRVLAGEHDVFWAEDDVFAGEHGETSSQKPLQRED